MPRLTRIAGSFLAILVAYGAYALLAVPWIEPSADLGGAEQITKRDRDRANELIDVRLKQFEGLFAPGRWELMNPKILESDRAKLLFQTYQNFPDGRVKLQPCTILFAYDGPAEDEAQRRRQTIVLEAPAGAVLQFDQPLDLNRARIGRLVRGQLHQEVRIRSDWKEPGPEDDLLIVARDIQLTEQTIATPNPVDFRWGRHFGRGQDMVIKLVAGPPRPGMEGSGPNITGIESFELRRVERLHLDLGQAVATPQQPPTSVPVDIACRGAFRFDVLGRVATFRDRVDVRKANPSGPADQLACEVLSLYFAERSQRAPDAPTPKAGSLDLVAQRLEARGNPAVVTAPSQKLVARGERLLYDLVAHSIGLDGGREVFLQQGPNEIHAKSLYYQAADQGRLGHVAAEGPGWLRGQSPDRPDQQLEAFWKKQLRVSPDKQNQLISLTGGSELKFQGVGQLQAREIFFWLTETAAPQKQQQSQFRPNRMLARYEVRMNSPQLSSKADQLEVWFDEAATGKNLTPGAKGFAASSGLPGSPPSQPGQPPPQSGQPNPLSPQTAAQRFEVVGRLLRTRIVLGGEQTAVSNLTIEDNVQFLETQTAKPGERPLLIRGDRLEAVDVSSPGATVTVTGRPARFEGRGLGLTGSNINFHRGANRLWIDGMGQMDLPLAGGLPMPGATEAAGGVMTVDWQGRMEFDGRTVRFERSVVAATAQQQLRTETMQIHLQRGVRFSEPASQEPPQVEGIQCNGGVMMEQRAFDQQQNMSSHDRLEVTDLAINILSGAMTAGGPGWLNSVRHGSENPLGGAVPATAESNAAANAAALQGMARPATVTDPLKCLHVRFQKSITGNLLQRQLTFHNQVQMAYAPVDNWDAMPATNNPDELGPQGVVSRCDQLSVVQMLLPLGNRRAIELVAQGNTVVEGTTFTATGNRITYAEGKDLLILEGDGRNDARLFRQLEAGAERSEAAARKILYWPKTKQVKVEGAQLLQIGQPASDNKVR